MDFRKATDALLRAMDQGDLADSLGVSVSSVRQARMDPKSKGWRPPPKHWREILMGVAAERAAYYRRLIDDLSKLR